MLRAFNSFLLAPKKRIAACLVCLLFLVVTIVIFSMANARLERENNMEEMIASQQSHIAYLESQYRGRQEDVLNLQANTIPSRGAVTNYTASTINPFTPEVQALLKNISGTHAAAGIYTKHIPQMRIPFVFQLLPYLMNDRNSLKPAYHMHGGRFFSEIVIGVPTVKRDMESYLMITLTHLLGGMTGDDMNSTIIIVMVGETDLEYVLQTAKQIEILFPRQVEQGIIEVLSPSAAYYPDFESIPDTLGDSHKRVKWRTKQNLDTIYLMAYAQARGTFYLMLEDDVMAKKYYMQRIKQYTAAITVTNPNWFYIDFCNIGGIGKLFRSSDLIHFITYVQLFYTNMPIDWLLESYLADKVCTIVKSSKQCVDIKLQIRPKYDTSLFQHIGLYSSLKGKIQKVKDTKLGPVLTFYPHTNPPLNFARTDIEVQAENTPKRAYEGYTYFWGVKPKKGGVVEFWFKRPTNIERYLFRSGNIEHITDKFYSTTVEVLPYSKPSDGKANFTTVGAFDEFGIAEGELNMGPIVAIRLRVNRDSAYWAILSEDSFIKKLARCSSNGQHSSFQSESLWSTICSVIELKENNQSTTS